MNEYQCLKLLRFSKKFKHNLLIITFCFQPTDKRSRNPVRDFKLKRKTKIKQKFGYQVYIYSNNTISFRKFHLNLLRIKDSSPYQAGTALLSLQIAERGGFEPPVPF